MKQKKEVKGVKKATSNLPTSRLPTLNYLDAFHLLVTEEAKAPPSDENLKNEIPAIISHWLQGQNNDPLILGKGCGARWTKKLLDAIAGDSQKTKKNDHKFAIDFSGLPSPPPKNPSFSFIDLFAGIGGFRTALQELGGRCVFTSEWDKHAKQTYFENYGEIPFGDIRNFSSECDKTSPFYNAIPKHDIIAGGFPCQAFSQAGKQLGFSEARGTLFFDILKIAEQCRPRALILENVKRLKTHDKGNTFAVIVNSLRELGYKVYAKVLRAYDFGVPQNRERIFIVAFDEPLHFVFPNPIEKRDISVLGDILENKTEDWYTISDRIYEGHKRRLQGHRSKGNGFGFSVFNRSAPYVNTLSARYWKDGSEILVEQDNKNPRMLTPRECARLQGFPDSFKCNASRRQAYQQFGNSVAVPVVKALASAVLKAIDENKRALSIDPSEPVIL